MSEEETRCPRCESTSVVHIPESIGFDQWHCNQCSHQWDFASLEERALVPNHLTGSRVEQFLEEFLAIKALIKAEAEQIWNSCSNAHQMISVAPNDEKPRVFSEQFDRWRDQLIGLQEMLIVDRLLPLVAKYQILANEQTWLLQACHEAWRPVTAGYLDWLTLVVRGHLHGVGTAAIPDWAWQLRRAPRGVAQWEQSAEKKPSAHFRCLVDTLQRGLVVYRKGAIAKAFLARKTNESLQAVLPRLHPSAPLSTFEATVGKLMVHARRGCPTKYLPQTEIVRIAELLDNKGIPVRSNLERGAARTMAEYNQHYPRAPIKSWRNALDHPKFRRAVRKRFSRAEDKYKKASVAGPSAGTSRTTI
jgi:hypothetical protein